MKKTVHGTDSYDRMCERFAIDVPEYYNFGFDVIDAWAKKDRNKLAMIWVNQQGEERKYSFLDLKNLSNKAANILLKYGIELTVPVEQATVNGKQVFVVGAGALLVCLDDEITTDVVEGIAKLKHKLDPETTQVVFKDAGFADSVVKTNAIQILKQAGIDDVKSI